MMPWLCKHARFVAVVVLEVFSDLAFFALNVARVVFLDLGGPTTVTDTLAFVLPFGLLCYDICILFKYLAFVTGKTLNANARLSSPRIRTVFAICGCVAGLSLIAVLLGRLLYQRNACIARYNDCIWRFNYPQYTFLMDSSHLRDARQSKSWSCERLNVIRRPSLKLYWSTQLPKGLTSAVLPLPT